MSTFFFASDLHGHGTRYASLYERIAAERPAAVLLGGDLMPHAFASLAVRGGARDGSAAGDFLADDLGRNLRRLRDELAGAYPRVLAILGNDDPRAHERTLAGLEAEGLLEHVHLRRVEVAPVPDGNGVQVYGCAWVPPTPFRLKDWERYDVGRGVDPGCLSPEEGALSVPIDPHVLRHATIAEDLATLAGDDDVADAIFLFHSPPYRSLLDRAALDGRRVDHVPLDVHVGSVAIDRFLRERQPRVALCGHVHESARLTGSWRDRIGRTHVFSAAHDGPELALVRFDPARPGEANRELIATG